MPVPKFYLYLVYTGTRSVDEKGKSLLYFEILNKVNNIDLLADLRLKGLGFIKFSAGCPQNISKFSLHLFSPSSKKMCILIPITIGA